MVQSDLKFIKTLSISFCVIVIFVMDPSPLSGSMDPLKIPTFIHRNKTNMHKKLKATITLKIDPDPESRSKSKSTSSSEVSHSVLT